jgi:hypothetical protein
LAAVIPSPQTLEAPGASSKGIEHPVVSFAFRRVNRRLPSVLWIALGWWSGYAVVFASQVMDMGTEQGRAIPWSEALKFSFGGWLTWVPLSVGLYYVVHRFPVQRGGLGRSLPRLMAAALAVVFLRGSYVYATNPVFGWYDVLPGFGSVLLASLRNNLVLAWTVIGLAHALVFYERAQERNNKVAELEAGLVAARLEALRAQINPHFLFNALNSVAELVHENADLADEMLLAISDLLRDSLAVDQPQERRLGDEVELVRKYLLVEKIRLGDRLQVRWEVDEACFDRPIPVFALQLLVENAVVHAISKRTEADRLIIRAGIEAGLLVIAVENRIPPTDGAAPAVAGLGLGLRSVGSRLRLLYGDDARMSRSQTPDGRHRMELRIPAPTTEHAVSFAGELGA